MKCSENRFYFFTCILPDYVAYERPKEFWKNSHSHDRLDLSFVKDFNVVIKKISKNGQKMAIYESYIFRIFSFKIEKSGNRKNCVLYCSFWSNQDLDMFSTSKCFSKDIYVFGKKNDQKWS